METANSKRLDTEVSICICCARSRSQPIQCIGKMAAECPGRYSEIGALPYSPVSMHVQGRTMVYVRRAVIPHATGHSHIRDILCEMPNFGGKELCRKINS